MNLIFFKRVAMQAFHWVNPINLVKLWFTYEPAPYEVIKSDDALNVITRCANDPNFGPHVRRTSAWEDLKNAPIEDYSWGILVFFDALAVVWLHFVFTS